VSWRTRVDEVIRRSPFRRRTVRFRLTALYCAVFFPAGVVLVVVTYVLILLIRQPKLVAILSTPSIHKHLSKGVGGGSHTPVTVAVAPKGVSGHPVSNATVTVAHLISLDGTQFLVGSCIVIVALIAVSILLGWIVAGRILRPLRTMTVTTRQISERNLHERLALDGPEDELTDLGHTIDGLLARLEAAFESQRRFVANASHELRTPLMLSQTILHVALANPEISLDSLRAAAQDALAAGNEQAQLIDALLTLARSQQGLERSEPVDLETVVREVIDTHGSVAAAQDVRIRAGLSPAQVVGDALLLRRLASNLVDNAIRYNMPDGRVEVTLTTVDTETKFTISNSGPPVAPGEVTRLLEPFQRAMPERTGHPDGLGLGLSIVADIVEAHGAHLAIEPSDEGGLVVTVTFTTL